MWMVTTRRPTDMANELWRMQGRLSRLMDEAVGSWPSGENGSLVSAWTPAVDVFEDKETLKIVAELPGVAPADVKITLENQVLTLRGEKRQVAEQQAERVHRYERVYGGFERAFTLPTTVDAERIQANYADGVLTVVLPKVERARPKEIPIQVG